MAAVFQFPYVLGLPLLPVQRVVAIDAGSHAIKILLAEKFGKSVRVLKRQQIRLHEEGLLSNEEIGSALAAVLRDMGDFPIALALPSHLPLSHILDLTAGSVAVKQLIEAETRKNRDLRDSPVVYDYAKLRPFGKHENAFLVTLCKEHDILDQIVRLAIPQEDVCEVVPPGNVLATAHSNDRKVDGEVALVDIGASGTVVSLCVQGQTVHTTSFAIGGNLFSETIAAANKCTIEAAETLKQNKNLLTGNDRNPALANVVSAWRDELIRAIDGWIQDNPEMNLAASSFKVILSGGASRQVGLAEFLSEKSVRIMRDTSENSQIPPEFRIVHGTALHALGASEQSTSLLPAILREDWRKRRVHQHLLTGVFAVLVATMILLALGTWQKVHASSQKQTLMEQANLALKKAEETALLEQELNETYARIRPVLRKGQQTQDTLRALQLLEQSRTNRNLWYVLFADQPTYFSPRNTNLPAQRLYLNGATNMALQRSGFVAELCINQEGEAMRQTLAQVVSELKQSSLFSNVDTLPTDLRRDLAYTNVILPDRHFALALEAVVSPFATVRAPEERSFTTNALSQPTGASRQFETNR